MTVSSTFQSVDNPAGVRYVAGKLTFDSSYPTGGEAISNTQWGDVNKAPDFVILQPHATDTGTVDQIVASWNKATGKVQLYWVDTTSDDQPLDEVTDTTSEATLVIDFLAIYLNPTPLTTV